MTARASEIEEEIALQRAELERANAAHSDMLGHLRAARARLAFLEIRKSSILRRELEDRRSERCMRAYWLRARGRTYKAIAAELTISPGRAREIVARGAEVRRKRIRDRDASAIERSLGIGNAEARTLLRHIDRLEEARGSYLPA